MVDLLSLDDLKSGLNVRAGSPKRGAVNGTLFWLIFGLRLLAIQACNVELGSVCKGNQVLSLSGIGSC